MKQAQSPLEMSNDTTKISLDALERTVQRNTIATISHIIYNNQRTQRDFPRPNTSVPGHTNTSQSHNRPDQGQIQSTIRYI